FSKACRQPSGIFREDAPAGNAVVAMALDSPARSGGDGSGLGNRFGWKNSLETRVDLERCAASASQAVAQIRAWRAADFRLHSLPRRSIHRHVLAVPPILSLANLVPVCLWGVLGTDTRNLVDVSEYRAAPDR